MYSDKDFNTFHRRLSAGDINKDIYIYHSRAFHDIGSLKTLGLSDQIILDTNVSNGDTLLTVGDVIEALDTLPTNINRLSELVVLVGEKYYSIVEIKIHGFEVIIYAM